MNPLQLGQQEEMFWCTFTRNSQFDAKWCQNLWCKRTRTNYCLNIYSIKIKFPGKKQYINAHVRNIINIILILCLMFFIKLKKKKEIKAFLANILSCICTSQKTNPTKVTTTSATLICYVLVSCLELNCTLGNITSLRPITKIHYYKTSTDWSEVYKKF